VQHEADPYEFAPAATVNTYIHIKQDFSTRYLRLPLMFGDAGFDVLDIGTSKAGGSSLVLWMTETRTYRSDQSGDGGAHRGFALPRSPISGCCCHGKDIWK
jgi:hypothetical protein